MQVPICLINIYNEATKEALDNLTKKDKPATTCRLCQTKLPAGYVPNTKAKKEAGKRRCKGCYTQFPITIKWLRWQLSIKLGDKKVEAMKDKEVKNYFDEFGNLKNEQEL